MTIKSTSGRLANIAVVGAGNMGSSIAVSLSQSGLPVKLIDCSASALASGLKRIEKIWNSLEQKAQKNQNVEMLADIKSWRSLICPIQSYAELHDADLVIEAVSEDIEIKKIILQTLDSTCQSKTILASNTSSFSITQLASFTQRPEQVIGMHFFNPAHIMNLIEVIPGLNTAPAVTETISHFYSASWNSRR